MKIKHHRKCWIDVIYCGSALKSSEYDVRAIHGYTKNLIAHVELQVYLDGKWVDVTFDKGECRKAYPSEVLNFIRYEPKTLDFMLEEAKRWSKITNEQKEIGVKNGL
jgi:hypothetical protein